jgi:hypothetical protein
LPWPEVRIRRPKGKKAVQALACDLHFFFASGEKKDRTARRRHCSMCSPLNRVPSRVQNKRQMSTLDRFPQSYSRILQTREEERGLSSEETTTLHKSLEVQRRNDKFFFFFFIPSTPLHGASHEGKRKKKKKKKKERASAASPSNTIDYEA